MNNSINIFTDGSSRGNPGPGGWGAVIVDGGASSVAGNKVSQVIELGGRSAQTTNNRMEINAALSALEEVLTMKRVFAADEVVTIFTDSSYLINGITKWVYGWKEKGWITSQKEEVQNRDLWEALLSAVGRVSRLGSGAGAGAKGRIKIEWKYVGGHVGIAGNERCDVIATSFADGEPTKLYRGSIDGYSIPNILDISASEKAVEAKSGAKSKKNKARSKAKAYSYVSALDGKVLVHQTWAECEARVKGKRGARFKKALSAGEERAISEEFSA